MDRDRQQDFEQLNAFIDGELDVDARARVTSRAARDPAYAHDLAALGRLKAALADAVPAPDIKLPPRPARRRLRQAATAAAASLALFAVAAAGWLAYDNRPAPGTAIALEWSIETHRSWTPDADRKGGAAALRPASATLRPVVPNLSANGLDLAYAGEQKAFGGENALVVGYLGSRGCRLTMIVQRADSGSPAEPVVLETGTVRAAIWRAGALRYAVLAEGMATGRFHLIADSIRRASVERLPLDQTTRTALAQNRAASRPCRA